MRHGIHRKPNTHTLASCSTDGRRIYGPSKCLDGKPQRGNIIKGDGGIRKLRYALPGRGKSGGVRVIYYWLRDDQQIYMLLIYPKSKKDNLTDRETAVLREFVKELW
ncbi:type II toxin-antitoxin system RelE/ParE family toxin [Mycetohabitans sp. B2]|uniref:type II toxin-antitoxin system RelE/ParE family toxin n=1 Tax=Mycetohabitans sp. B2 TaxID=2841274 RepID=UPI001F2478C3|nr:type II toxin-antitoxin system RelE/ParE family toxin [Mycetohabitans sp. B2]